MLTALAVLAGAAPAHATGYRYWSFWERTGSHWSYATQGPSTARPEDGAVEGFRFAVSADSADAARPRGAADFGAVCAGTPAKPGTKRVALVLDFGTRADAPSGETPPGRRTACARVAPDATAAEALAATAKPLRYDTNALLCAISGYPRTGCGEQVSGSSAGNGKVAGGGTGVKGDGGAQDTASARPGDGNGSGPSLGLPLGIAAVVLLGGAAVWQTRRRRDA
ncbi:hypothetical protein KUM39_05075 [Streptomyces sp. J2-1]|uniref:SCO2322 family protein n=1 Tax=Streptomyces corallincola TaxID=2851888 RepID=UPI001C38806F|nr:SCO2322 family protein [Streptomyces corallincola]MBV2353737.1 hypothetical protein [Streptomyces corallincola]